LILRCRALDLMASHNETVLITCKLIDCVWRFRIATDFRHVLRRVQKADNLFVSRLYQRFPIGLHYRLCIHNEHIQTDASPSYSRFSLSSSSHFHEHSLLTRRHALVRLSFHVSTDAGEQFAPLLVYLRFQTRRPSHHQHHTSSYPVSNFGNVNATLRQSLRIHCILLLTPSRNRVCLLTSSLNHFWR
jgi:hypothetical protein